MKSDLFGRVAQHGCQRNDSNEVGNESSHWVDVREVESNADRYHEEQDVDPRPKDSRPELSHKREIGSGTLDAGFRITASTVHVVHFRYAKSMNTGSGQCRVRKRTTGQVVGTGAW
jgi:hypothetical protein